MATSNRKEDWRLCAEWLVRCQILADGHRVTFPTAQVFDLVQVLRDGVLICHLLNRLYPGAVDSKDFSQRPQMSQFLCLKNIRVFLQACKNVFNLEDKDLFEPYDLFEVKDFGKVIKTLAKLSSCPVAHKSQIEGFEICVEPAVCEQQKSAYKNLSDFNMGFLILKRKEDDDIYGPLSDIAVSIPEEDIYDPVCQEDDHDIYDDLCSLRQKPPQGQQPTSRRDYCIKEIMETEKNYTEALNMVVQHFIRPLKNILPSRDHEIIFFGIEELSTRHTGFHNALTRANSGRDSYASNRVTIPDCFVQWKEKFLIYGDFCSNLPRAQELVDELSQKNPLIQSSIMECQIKANGGKFRLRDLLSVPMQRVLKYHLLLKELIKNTPEDHPELRSLERALEEMQDLSLYVNEVKRDNEQLQLIQEIQHSIIDLQMPQDIQLKDYGRIQLDGELKVKNHEDTGRNKTRYVFVFDKVMLLCKSRGDCYNFRDALVLSQFKVEKIENTPRNHLKAEKGWQFPFLLAKKSTADGAPPGVWTIFCKTDETRKKWMDAIEMAQDNTSPKGARDGNKDFIMHTFMEATICDYCKKLLRGVFYQGYKCQKTGLAVHKECVRKALDIKGPPEILPRTPAGQNSIANRLSGGDSGAPPIPMVPPRIKAKCKANRAYQGTPCPSDSRATLNFNAGDTLELLNDDDDFWWEGRLNGATGFFPSRCVQKTDSPRRSQSFQTNGETPSAGSPQSSVQKVQRHHSFDSQILLNNKPSPKQSPKMRHKLSLPPPNPPLDLSSYPWFVGQMARDTAVKRLEHHKSGTYLIRERIASVCSRDYALSMKYVKTVKHIKVQRSPDNHYFLADSHMFRTIPDLVTHYQRNTLGNSFPELPTTLQIPFKDAERQIQTAGTTAGSDILGRCKSIYPFAANQANQLSLEKDDIIEVISKAGGDRGWWKGRKDGKVGYFPCGYVVELDDLV